MMRDVLIFDARRSRSAMRCSCPVMLSRKTVLRVRYSTMFALPQIFLRSLSGKVSHRFSSRPPIAVCVRSMTLSSEVPSAVIGARISSERSVNRSILTYLSVSIAFSVVMCPMLSWCVICRYCMTAPAAVMPLRRWSMPKPFIVATPKCRFSFCSALCGAKAQSSSA